MNTPESVIGKAVGGLGILACAVAIALRLLGMYTVMGFSTGAMLQAGMAALLTGCFLLLLALTKTR